MAEFKEGDKVKIIKLESNPSKLKDEGEIIKVENERITVKLDTDKLSSTNTNKKVCLKVLWIIMAIMAAACLLIIFWKVKIPDLSNNNIAILLHQILSVSWRLLISIWLLGIIISHFSIFLAMLLLRRLLNVGYLDDDNKTNRVADYLGPAYVGICEHILYPTVLLMQKPEFIGVWLALKAFGQSTRFTMTKDKEKGDTGYRLLNKFLIGNALSIIFGILIYGVIKAFVFK